MSFCRDAASFRANTPPQIPKSVCRRSWFGIEVPTSFLFRAHAHQRVVVSFTCLLNVLRLLARLAPASICRLVSGSPKQFILLHFEPAKEKEISTSLSAHTASFTFDYGPSAGSTLNQCELRNAASAVCTEKTVSASGVASV